MPFLPSSLVLLLALQSPPAERSWSLVTDQGLRLEIAVPTAEDGEPPGLGDGITLLRMRVSLEPGQPSGTELDSTANTIVITDGSGQRYSNLRLHSCRPAGDPDQAAWLAATSALLTQDSRCLDAGDIVTGWIAFRSALNARAITSVALIADGKSKDFSAVP